MARPGRDAAITGVLAVVVEAPGHVTGIVQLVIVTVAAAGVDVQVPPVPRAQAVGITGLEEDSPDARHLGGYPPGVLAPRLSPIRSGRGYPTGCPVTRRTRRPSKGMEGRRRAASSGRTLQGGVPLKRFELQGVELEVPARAAFEIGRAHV